MYYPSASVQIFCFSVLLRSGASEIFLTILLAALIFFNYPILRNSTNPRYSEFHTIVVFARRQICVNSVQAETFQ